MLNVKANIRRTKVFIKIKYEFIGPFYGMEIFRDFFCTFRPFAFTSLNYVFMDNIYSCFLCVANLFDKKISLLYNPIISHLYSSYFYYYLYLDDRGINYNCYYIIILTKVFMRIDIFSKYQTIVTWIIKKF
jgi:hypothetical protein